MKAIHVFLLIAALILSVQVEGALGGSSGDVFRPDPGAIEIVHRGLKIYCQPQDVNAAKYVVDLVDAFDQEVLGRDLPHPKTLTFKEEINWNGSSPYGVTNHASNRVAVATSKMSIEETVLTVFHEFLHVDGLKSDRHPYIYAMEKQLLAVLKARGLA